MFDYSFGKKISFLGFSILAFSQIILMFITLNYNIFFHNVCRILIYGGILLAGGGYALMFLNKRDILDLPILAAMGLMFFIEIFAGRLPLAIYNWTWNLFIPLLLYVPMVLQCLRVQNMPIFLLVVLAFAYAIIGKWLLSVLCFRFFGLDNWLFRSIINCLGPSCCDGISALFSITKE